MNKIVLSFLIIVTLFTVSGCSEKFDIAAPYKNITVIYAFLDRADTAHYVRIQKAFLDQDKSAIAMAQEPDSNFYANINVRINRLSITDTNRVVDTIHLTRVDLNQEGYPKQPGMFFTAPNYAYKFKQVLDPRYFYRIVVTNLVTGEVDSALAPVIDDVTARSLVVDVIDDVAPPAIPELDFASTAQNQTYDFSVIYSPVPGFNYYGYTSPAFMAYSVIRFNYVDSNNVTHEITPRSYDFVIGNKTLSSGVVANYKVQTLSFYSAIASGIGTAPENIYRLMDRCDLITYVTTVDYYNYQQATATAGVGLTGNEIHPVYTNIKGANALGLFTSRGVRSGKLKITAATMNEVIRNSLVSRVRFVGTVYQ